MQKRQSKVISISLQPSTLLLLDELAKSKHQNRSEFVAGLVLEENFRQNKKIIDKVKSLLHTVMKSN